MDNRVFVIGYPAVSSLFFKENYEVCCSTSVEIILDKREIVPDKKIVAILSDPKQLIIARATVSKKRHNSDDATALKLSMQKYISMYQKIVETPDIVCIDYEDLVGNFLEVAKKISNKFNNSVDNNFNPIPELDVLQKYKSESMVDMAGYEEVVRVAEMIDFSRCYQIYEHLMKRAI